MNACIMYKETYSDRPDAAIKIAAVGTISAMRAEMARIADSMKDDLSSFIRADDGTLMECCRTMVEPDGITYERYLLVG